jgi:hypothetical protein
MPFDAMQLMCVGVCRQSHETRLPLTSVANVITYTEQPLVRLRRGVL